MFGGTLNLAQLNSFSVAWTCWCRQCLVNVAWQYGDTRGCMERLQSDTARACLCQVQRQCH